MASFRRYAVFWTPPRDSALARFGAGWLGWDADSGKPARHPELPGLPAPPGALTATPRRYGFHGTLKPPFRLAEGLEFEALERAMAALAAEVAPFDCPPLALASIGPFVALLPSAPCLALADLAGRCVTTLDRFRAPPAESELARRRAAGLTPRQEEHLARWGYPYVLDQFRFHLTLTGVLNSAGRAAVIAALEGPTEAFRAQRMPVCEICLFGEDEAGNFRIVRRHALTG